MKKLLTILLTVAMAAACCFGMVGCNDEEKTASDVKVGLICLHGDSSTYDKNFIDAMKEACENMNADLVIKTDVPVTLDMDALRREQPDEETLRKMFEDLEFKSLIDRLFKKEKAPLPPPSDQGTLFALFDAAPQEELATPSRLSHLEDLPYHYHLVETDADRRALAETIKDIIVEQRASASLRSTARVS